MVRGNFSWVSAFIFGAVIAAITAAWYPLDLNPVLACWSAYVLTRPLGASIGDGLSQATKDGGFGLGTTNRSYTFLACILVLVVFLMLTRRDQTPPQSARA